VTIAGALTCVELSLANWEILTIALSCPWICSTESLIASIGSRIHHHPSSQDLEDASISVQPGPGEECAAVFTLAQEDRKPEGHLFGCDSEDIYRLLSDGLASSAQFSALCGRIELGDIVQSPIQISCCHTGLNMSSQKGRSSCGVSTLHERQRETWSNSSSTT